MKATILIATMFVVGTLAGNTPAQVPALDANQASTAAVAQLRVYRYNGIAYLRKSGRGGTEITLQLSGEVVAPNGDIATALAGQAIANSAEVRRYVAQGWDYRGCRAVCTGPIQ